MRAALFPFLLASALIALAACTIDRRPALPESAQANPPDLWSSAMSGGRH